MSTKALVNAIIDAQHEAERLMEEATAEASTFADRMRVLARKLAASVRLGLFTPARAKELWREAFVKFSLLGFTRVAQDVIDHAKVHTAAIHGEARALKSGVKATQVIRKLDMVARKAERDAKKNP